jgi:hypothetical protein
MREKELYPVVENFLKTQKNCLSEYVGTELSLKSGKTSLRADVLDVSKGKLLYSKEEWLQEGT